MEINRQVLTKQFFLIFVILLTISTIHAQKIYQTHFQLLDDSNEHYQQIELDTILPKDSMGVFSVLKSVLAKLRDEGYLAVSVDTVRFLDTVASVDFYLGNKYQWAQIQMDSQQVQLLKDIEPRYSIREDETYDPSSLNVIFDKIVTEYENNGYPFAQVSIVESIIEGATIRGKLEIRRNQQILFDTFHLVNPGIISRKFLHRYLDLERASPYSREKILKLKPALRKLAYLRLKEDPTVRFTKERAIIQLNLEKKKASRFDFLFGILPSTNNGESSLTIAVDFTADLINKFQRGEQLFVRFQRLRDDAQELELAFNYPFLLDTPFGLDSRFELFRSGDDFIELETDLGIRYLFSTNNYLKVFWNLHSSRLLDLDTTAILNSRRLPQQLDLRYTAGGLELGWENLDYPLNPMKGIDMKFRGSAGFKKILENNEILSISNEQVDFSTAYDSLKLDAYQFRLEADLSYFIPFSKRSSLRSSAKSGWIIAEDATYTNELFRIGGHKLMRGFDEESILADFYAVFGLEFRLLLAENSYLALPFFDLGVIQNKSLDDPWDTVMGMGGGIHFETAAGIFSFSVAVGRQQGNAFDFGSTKAHFGYVSLF